MIAPMASLFEQVGGMDGLRAVLRSFYDAVFADVMIGFHFRKADKERLIEKGAELTARILGASHIQYTGMAIPEAHHKHPILGGQFERRMVLLQEAMDAHKVPPAVQDAWLDHTRALRPQVTRDAGSGCDHAKNPGGPTSLKIKD
jgi:truncated hemoglobin YjbI